MKVFIFLLGIIIFLGQSQITEAHVGGIPFLKINGEYAPANAAYFSNPNLSPQLPQDLGPTKYVVGTVLNFEIDTTQIPLPKETLETATFRWSFERDSTDYQYGLTQTHTYNTPGSHIISLDVKAADEAQFTPYDLIQVDIVKDENYQLPQASIEVEVGKRKNGQPVSFTAKIKTDSSASLTDTYWFVDGQKYSNKSKLDYTFSDPNLFTLVFLEYTDSNGFKGYRAVWVEAVEGDIDFPFPPNSRDEITLIEPKEGVFDLRLLLIGLFALPVFLIVFLLKKK